MRNKTHLHHSHSLISGEVFGYAYSYCNQKRREKQSKISVVAQNLFRFDFFFFLLKGLTAGVWRTRDISIGGKNLANINFANIGNQVVFIDTIKCFQQSLGTLASNLTDNKKPAVWKECQKFIRKDKNLCGKFELCSAEEQEWALDYLSKGKGTILYEMITRYNSLDIAAEDKKSFFPHHFYSSLKHDVMTREEYEHVKKKVIRQWNWKT